MDKEAVSSKALKLGRQYNALREQNNLTLSQVSSSLDIRSVLLNDMEKGRFAHLNIGECLAYAKFLGIDLNEVYDVFAELKGGEATSTKPDNANKLKLIGGITFVVVIVIIMVFALSANSSNDNATSLGAYEPNSNLKLEEQTVKETPKKEAPVAIKENLQENIPLNNSEKENLTKTQNNIEIKEEAPSLAVKEANDSSASMVQDEVVAPITSNLTKEQASESQDIGTVKPNNEPQTLESKDLEAITTASANANVNATPNTSTNNSGLEILLAPNNTKPNAKDLKPQETKAKEEATKVKANTKVVKVKAQVKTSKSTEKPKVTKAISSKPVAPKAKEVKKVADSQKAQVSNSSALKPLKVGEVRQLSLEAPKAKFKQETVFKQETIKVKEASTLRSQVEAIKLKPQEKRKTQVVEPVTSTQIKVLN